MCFILDALTIVIAIQLPPIETEIVKVTKTKYVATTVYPCAYDFNPVCGSDGLTYQNKCILESTSKENKYKGLPPIDAVDESKCTECKCKYVDLPVCTLDGVTYPNECELSCENQRRIQSNQSIIYLAYRRPCLGPSCGCSTIASPVCGTDNVLYRNRCVLECAAYIDRINGYYPVEFKNAGACLDRCQCPDKLEPVCGSDTIIYDNLCELTCENSRYSHSKNPVLTVAHSNICFVCDCPTTIDPVCGSDGKMKPKTYQNPCHLNCEAKHLRNPYLKEISSGPCPKYYCTDVDSPVCGTDNKTYKNLCSLRSINDNVPEDKRADIYYYGKCKDHE